MIPTEEARHVQQDRAIWASHPPNAGRVRDRHVHLHTGVSGSVHAPGRSILVPVALVTNVTGVIMALVTAIPGFLDWLLGIPAGTRAKSAGLTHMLLNVSALVVFAINAFMNLGQWNATAPDATL
ncbi:MAG: DUF2231 domain-containing protein [Chloroflexi bacterium]|nr:DUF2231 domain-containing protein [Chloroflexota bacterium]